MISVNLTPGISSPTTLWYKYSDYVLMESTNDIYLLPAGNSDEIFYTPCENSETLLLDYIDASVNIFQKFGLDTLQWDKKMKFDIGRECIELAKRYGLLGYLNVMKRNLISNDSNRYLELWKQFYPTLSMDNVSFITGKYYCKEDPSVLRRNYAESVTHFIECIGYLYKYSMLWNRYEQDHHKPNDIYDIIPEDVKLNEICPNFKFIGLEETWSERLCSFINIPVNIGISRKSISEWDTAFSFESLYDIICLSLIQKNTSSNKLRFCGKCKKPFIQESPKQAYCSLECRRIASVNRNREKVKTAKQLFKEGYSIDEISTKCNTTVDQIKKWIEGE